MEEYVISWIENSYESFNAAVNLYPNSYLLTIVGREVKIIDIKRNRTAVAKCRKDDYFNSMTGIAIAWARLVGVKIPVPLMHKMTTATLKDVKEGEYFYLGTRYFRKIANPYEGELNVVCCEEFSYDGTPIGTEFMHFVRLKDVVSIIDRKEED